VGLGVEGGGLVGGGAAFGAEGGEAALQAEAELAVGVVVAGGFEGFDLGQEVLLGPAELVQARS